MAQLWSERTVDHRLSWRRAALLDRLQFDVFKHYYRAQRPDFSTFFINSTAHLQHSYWRHFDPQAFTVQPDSGETALYGDAMLYGYKAMDDLLGDFMALADSSGARLVFATALSQQPYLDAEASGGRHFYRLFDVEGFFRRYGIAFSSIDPTMTHQYLAHFASAEQHAACHQALAGFTLPDGKPVFDINARTQDGLYFSCNVRTDLDVDVQVAAPDGSAVALATLFYKIDATKSGRHHPEGALWIAGAAHKTVPDPVSILDIFPTTLDLLGIDQPRDGDRQGRTLIDHIN
jgi:hypothetical protein